MKTIVIYGNCQGTLGLKHFINKYTPNFQVHCISNYEVIEKNGDLPIDLLKVCDVFIYQPIQKCHGIYSTEGDNEINILSFLKLDCIKISFPYIYFPCIFTFNAFEKYELPHNFDTSLLNYKFNSTITLNSVDKNINKFIISGLENVTNIFLNNSKRLDLVFEYYDNNKIDFNFKTRFDIIVNNLKEREKTTDIKVSQYIVDNLNNKLLFLTHNHPTSYIFIHMLNQIYKIINIEQVKNIDVNLNEAELPSDLNSMTFDSYNYNYYNFDFKNNDPEIYICDFESYISFYSKNDDKTKKLIQHKLCELC